MATFSKTILSGSTDGRGIKVAATATAGTTVHTGSSTPTTLDEIWLYAVNTSATDVKLTVEWGGVSSPDDHIEYTVKAENGLYLIAAPLNEHPTHAHGDLPRRPRMKQNSASHTIFTGTR